MHSNIYQISSKPIEEDGYSFPEKYYEDSCFADYIRESYKDAERQEHIKNFGTIIKDVFETENDGVFVYKGKAALRAFKEKWAAALKHEVDALSADNLFEHLYSIGRLTRKTHLDVYSRVDIEEWTGGSALPFSELFEWAGQLKKGDRIYVGAVLDYHF